LLKAVRETEKKTHVDLGAHIQVCVDIAPLVLLAIDARMVQDITLKYLPVECYPCSAPTDKLASLVEKDRAKKVRHSFGCALFCHACLRVVCRYPFRSHSWMCLNLRPHGPSM